MKSIEINGKKLSYSEVNSEKSFSLLFLNGNSHSRKSFHKQLNDKKFENFRLIAVDLPGHGDSSFFENYSLINIAELLQKFVQVLKIEHFLIVGHSLGGHVALHLLKNVTPDGLVIFGTPPLSKPFNGESFLLNENSSPLSQQSATMEQLDKLSEELKYTDYYKEQFPLDYFKADKNFRDQIFKTVGTDQYFDEVNLLKNSTAQTLAIICHNDKIISNDYARNILSDNPMCTVVELASGHSPQLEDAEKFNEILINFADEVFDKKNYHGLYKSSKSFNTNQISI